MHHSRALVWQPVYCQHGIMPNAIALDTDFAIRCSRIPLTLDLQAETYRLAFGHLRDVGFTETPPDTPVFSFSESTLLLDSVSHWSDPQQRLELQRIGWKGEATNRHLIFAFVDDRCQRDIALRQGLQSAFAWWVAYAARTISRSETTRSA